MRPFDCTVKSYFYKKNKKASLPAFIYIQQSKV